MPSLHCDSADSRGGDSARQESPRQTWRYRPQRFSDPMSDPSVFQEPAELILMYTNELLTLLWVGALVAEVRGVPAFQGDLAIVAESMVKREYWRWTVIKPRRLRMVE